MMGRQILTEIFGTVLRGLVAMLHLLCSALANTVSADSHAKRNKKNTSNGERIFLISHNYFVDYTASTYELTSDCPHGPPPTLSRKREGVPESNGDKHPRGQPPAAGDPPVPLYSELRHELRVEIRL